MWCEKIEQCQNHQHISQVLQSDLVWTYKWPFQGWKRDLSLGNHKVTLKKLEHVCKKYPWYFSKGFHPYQRWKTFIKRPSSGSFSNWNWELRVVEKDSETTTNLGSIFWVPNIFSNRCSRKMLVLDLVWDMFMIFCYLFLSTLVYFITTKRYHFQENIFPTDLFPTIEEFDHKPWRWKSSAFFGAKLWWSCSRTRQWNGSRLSWLGDLLIFFCPSFVRESWHVSRFPSYWVDLLLSFSPKKNA